MKFTWSINILMLLFVFSSCGEEGEIVGEEHEDTNNNRDKFFENLILQNDSIENQILKNITETNEEILTFQNKVLKNYLNDPYANKILNQTLLINKWSKDLCNFYTNTANDLITFSIRIKETTSSSLTIIDQHSTLDSLGYLYLSNIKGIPYKEDYEAPRKMFIGELGDMKNPIGDYLIDSLHNFRNKLTHLLGKSNEYNFTFPKDLQLAEFDDKSRLAFENQLDAELANSNPVDTSIIKSICTYTTLPSLAVHHSELVPWIVYSIGDTPLIISILTINCNRLFVSYCEKEAVKHLINRF